MEQYFTSDLHFGHKNILKYCPDRKFEDVSAMNEYIVEHWNSIVKPRDVVYFIGDLSLSQKIALEYIAKLQGKIVVVPGNHDAFHPMHKKSKQAALELFKANANVETIIQQMTMKIGEYEVLLCHFPYEQKDERKYTEFLPKRVKGQFLLHGHNHSTPETKIGYFEDSCDVGWDAWHKLVHIDEIEEVIDECYEHWLDPDY